ncbi:alpha/beta hydrolase [Amycolatopsis mediterranei S699]|uniref:Alpha/beta hydrolase n=4 Tax=Amycolatopsis mediterranei TaxID=33910 RepID=A0A0H3D2C4_AMYMU|nr:alpha/beta hydrolase [Amycolatopsis mediterranei]ADJ44422.1 alpha/beta hydrolase [Amycolatopsis mediterranei U32]AEK41160.1 alpha/beta hydrolase [Amycolatopsis mediterranei S699]AFO76135.1 alpha/beta hydrolase [Amycolatopsis mediterranei S699]AGT83264.1 alpha/beta hydrolase [Amycolatopsis mediterranei RB]KDO06660.1 alpha/beta hydrolase [Amycolatopsis mediterranei]
MLNGLSRRLLVRSIMAGLRFLLRLPSPVLRVIAGRPVVVDSRQPVPTARVLMRVARFAPFDAPHHNGSLSRARTELNLAGALAGAGICPGVRTSDASWPGPGGPLPLRLYEPAGVPAPGPAIVYFHGGGFVLGSLDTHEGACRLLAEEAGVRVVSIGYRLAPEHPFPAAASDAVAAFAHVVSHAAEFGVDPARLAVGGDSSGGNLAAVVAHAAARGELSRPAFSLLLTPATDALGESASHRQFGSGFRLDRDEWAWYRAQYLRDPALYRDPRASVLYDESLDGLPPTFVATCGFDLLRDEGEAYAARLAAAGVPLVHRRHEGQLHGFANRVGVDPDARAAMLHAAGVLRAGLALSLDRDQEDDTRD